LTSIWFFRMYVVTIPFRPVILIYSHFLNFSGCKSPSVLFPSENYLPLAQHL
jgi:hypothetical protein